jgi:hypothetical protein
MQLGPESQLLKPFAFRSGFIESSRFDDDSLHTFFRAFVHRFRQFFCRYEIYGQIDIAGN